MIEPEKIISLNLPSSNGLSPQEILYLSDMRISDLEAIRLVLNGDSVIDWFRLDFENHLQIDQFLLVNGYDPQNVQDIRRIERIQRQALEFLDSRYPHRIPPEIRSEHLTIHQLFYMASRSARRMPTQFYACLLLKIMHTINHLDARELFHRCEVRASDMYRAVEKKIENTVRTMQQNDFHIVDFYGSHKDKHSMVTKLLAKKENHAAAIYDKIRFRIITKTTEDMLPVLYFLGKTICPFNYVIPGSSHNNLVDLPDLLAHFPNFRQYERFLRASLSAAKMRQTWIPDNQFTSPSYKAINIVCDIPIRVDQLLYTPDFTELGRLIFVPVEFQIMDQTTYQNNEAGDANHSRYKQRQMDAVNTRLGMDGTTER